MDVEKKYEMASRNTIEIVTPDELRRIIEAGGGKGYLGFEPSGLFHIGWLLWAYKFRDLVNAGFRMYLLAATWHAWINDKLGGDMELIKAAATHVVEVLNSIGLEGRFEVVYADTMVADPNYWEMWLKAAKNASLARVRRALTIMGRKADEAETDFSKLVYPLMQVTDIYYLDVDIALGGMDQRKAHMLARDIAENLNRKKVVAIHTPLITSLIGAGRMDVKDMEIDEIMAEVKMSKSKPETTIFVTDSDEEIRKKIRKAYCPAKEVEGNPIMELARYIIFYEGSAILDIDRPSKYGGPITITSYEDLEKIYLKGELHPLDLKNAVAEHLIKIIRPIRDRTLSNEQTRKLVNIIKKSVTR